MTEKLLKNNNESKSSTKSETSTFWGNWLTGFMILLVLAGLNSCIDDNETGLAEPWGSWTHTVTGAETFHTQLNLKDNIFEWIVLDTLSSHTNSYGKVEVTGSQLRLYDNPDCASDGAYKWSVAGEKLSLEAVDDACDGRVLGLLGTWDKLDTTVMLQLSGSWTKKMEVEGVFYDVKLTMNANCELLWEMIDPIPGHTNSSVSYTVIDNVIIIYNDAQCGGNGYFEFKIEGGTLTINTIKDSCPPRSPSFTSDWTKM